MPFELPKLDLPVEEVLDELKDTLEDNICAVLQAPPGAGKTTLVPLKLLGAHFLNGKKILMLEPRRLAAKTVAERMASLLGEKVGETVGYRVRLDSKVSSKTKIEVVTEGILTRKLQSDPELEDTAVVIFDEFHERSIHSDLGLALVRQAQEYLRDDIRILVMSATLDAENISALLDDAPVITSEGKIFPVETKFADRPVKGRYDGFLSNWIKEIIEEDQMGGDMLVFLPGAGEINRVAAMLEPLAKNKKAVIHKLYGNLSQKEQELALKPNADGIRKIVLSTDIAETSLTIEGVHIVVDTGLSRKPLFDPNSGMSKLQLKKIARSSADQRRGRAGRLGPGVCYRMWTKQEDRALIAQSEPEIINADLSSLKLELAKWGVEDYADLAWPTEPPSGTMAQANDLLEKLGALDADGRITEEGKRIVAMPLHPRLAHMILRAEEIGQLQLACDLAALLSERDILREKEGAGSSEIRLRLELLNRARHKKNPDLLINRVLRNAKELASRSKANSDDYDISLAGIVLSFAYPDRIGELRQKGKRQYRLSGGRGAEVKENDKLIGEPYLVVADIDGRGRDASIRLAAPVTYQQLLSFYEDDIQHRINARWDEEKAKVVVDEEDCIGALVLTSRRISKPEASHVTTAICGYLRAKELRPLPWSRASEALLERVAFLKFHSLTDEEWPDLSKAWLTDNLDDWLSTYTQGKTTLKELENIDLATALKSLLSWEQQQFLDEKAPAKFKLPTGNNAYFDYSNPELPVLAARMQELFGVSDIPPLLNGSLPVSIHLLSPARRPAQITNDLAGFWKNSYSEVKKDLKGQYPKHYWPDDPLQAEPTAKAKPRKN